MSLQEIRRRYAAARTAGNVAELVSLTEQLIVEEEANDRAVAAKVALLERQIAIDEREQAIVDRAKRLGRQVRELREGAPAVATKSVDSKAAAVDAAQKKCIGQVVSILNEGTIAASDKLVALKKLLTDVLASVATVQESHNGGRPLTAFDRVRRNQAFGAMRKAIQDNGNVSLLEAVDRMPVPDTAAISRLCERCPSLGGYFAGSVVPDVQSRAAKTAKFLRRWYY